MSERARAAADALYGGGDPGEHVAANAGATAAMVAHASAPESDALSRAHGARGRECIIRGIELRKRYVLGKNNFVDALRGATLDITRGEMAAIMGPSGSGKSTFMHIAGCLDAADGGEVWLNGRRVDGLSGAELTRIRRGEIGFIFQGFNLIPTLTAEENVALSGEYAGLTRGAALERARELLGEVGLGDRMKHVPSELSGGQQQRVAIARSLVNDPGIVMGDEPTGDLDTATSEEIVAMMRRVNQERGTTFLIVTHNPEVASACDRTIRMRDGVVIDDGDGTPQGAGAA